MRLTDAHLHIFDLWRLLIYVRFVPEDRGALTLLRNVLKYSLWWASTGFQAVLIALEAEQIPLDWLVIEAFHWVPLQGNTAARAKE